MGEPRILYVPHDVEEIFLSAAETNTKRGIETCGLLCGRMESEKEVYLTHLIIPPQVGTHNTVEMLNDEGVASLLIQYNLHVVGWIHTHPTQTAFLSSVDLHTQQSYQALCKEAVAVVCAPAYNCTKWLRLTAAGMKVVGDCSMDGFHEHVSKSRLFQPALNVYFCERQVSLVDAREKLSGDNSNLEDTEGVPQVMGSTDHRKKTPGDEAGHVTLAAESYAKTDTQTESTKSLPEISASKLRNLAVKIEKARSHKDFLSTCVREHLIVSYRIVYYSSQIHIAEAFHRCSWQNRLSTT